ncbi:MAG: hypothetical protein AAF902_26735 [Chloroflexota bacterium]
MDLTCTHCAQPIPIENYDWVRLAAECPHCNQWSGFNQPTQEFVNHTNEIFQTNQLYLNYVSRLIITRSPHTTKIELPSHKVQTADEKQANVLGKWMSTVLLLIAFVLGVAIDISGFSDVLLIALFAIPGFILATFMMSNSGTYIVSMDRTAISSHIEVIGGFRIREKIARAADFNQFYVKRRAAHRANTTYGLYGIASNGDRSLLLRGNETLMLLAESELERLLKIDDAAVAGAVVNPFHQTVSAQSIPPWVTGVRIRHSGEMITPTARMADLLDQIQLDEKSTKLSYSDDAYIDFVRAMSIQQSDEARLLQNAVNRTVSGLVSALKAFGSALLYFIGGGLIWYSFENGGFAYLPGIALIMFGIIGGRHLLDWFFNSQIVLIDRENLYLSSRPFPRLNPDRKMISHGHFKQFYVRPQTGLDLFFGPYALMGIDQNNRYFKVCTGSEKFLLLLEKEIEAYLKLRDIPVGGSVDNPYQEA